MRHLYWGAALLLAALCTAAQAQISLVPGTVNMFRDTRGANDVGIGQGDRFQFGADVVGGSLGLTVGGNYLPSGVATSPIACSPLTVNANFCAGSTPFNSSRLGAWTMTFREGAQSLTVAAPLLAGAETAVPFPVSVTLNGAGTSPTISWNVPGGFAPDGFRVNIFDRDEIRVGGQADIIHSVAIAPSATSYTIPDSVLALGGNYAINLQLIETRGHVAFTNNNAQILRRSSSFFAFTPLSGANPPAVALPTIVDGVYNFNIGEVGPDAVTFIDPLVAIGYDYAIGAGDPNFASVLLPDVGDGEFTLDYVFNGQSVHTSLADGIQFFFPQGGVGAFRVGGIELSAGLDPADASSFITGLTFAANGHFTGTMTPITVDVPAVGAVPEPSTWALVIVGVAGLLARRRFTPQR
jgi:hypothetical protein